MESKVTRFAARAAGRRPRIEIGASECFRARQNPIHWIRNQIGAFKNENGLVKMTNDALEFNSVQWI